MAHCRDDEEERSDCQDDEEESSDCQDDEEESSDCQDDEEERSDCQDDEKKRPDCHDDEKNRPDCQDDEKKRPDCHDDEKKRPDCQDDEKKRPDCQALPPQVAAQKKEFYFHLFFHEIFVGADQTTVTAISPNTDFPNFGEIGIMDVPLWDNLKQNKVLARCQGTAIQSDQKTFGWHLSFNIVFEMPELKGSTLQVQGQALQLLTPREWSIVGGTGEFTLAQGMIYGRRLSSPDLDDSIWVELKIHGYYTPMQRPQFKINSS